MKLLNKEKLEQSWVVANNQMNRKRTDDSIGANYTGQYAVKSFYK